MDLLSIEDIDVAEKRVVVRVDFNVPMEKGQILNDARIQRSLSTIRQLRDCGARILLLSHLGRPKEGMFDPQLSLLPVAERLETILNQPVELRKNWLEGGDIAPSQVVLAENVRFEVGEKANDPDLAKRIANLGDIFVMDAFATAHRAQASTVGVAEHIPQAVAGPLLLAELKALEQALANPVRPVCAIVGGSKVSGKLEVLTSLIEQTEVILVGGGIANTFIAANDYKVGSSLFEPDLIEVCKELMIQAKNKGVKIVTPIDVIVAKKISNDAKAQPKLIGDVSRADKILDIGPSSAQQYAHEISNAKTILWNGPVGAFEYEPFQNGTQIIAEAVANSEAFSIAGGGDTLNAIDKYQIADRISYISTGGGAFLEYVEGKILPAVAILAARAKEKESGYA